MPPKSKMRDNVAKLSKPTDAEHTQKRMNVYIGDWQPKDIEAWVLPAPVKNVTRDRVFDFRKIKGYSPGIAHLVKEAVNNATDNAKRTRAQGYDAGDVEVTYTPHMISVKNYGMGIPVVKEEIEVPITKQTIELWRAEVLFGLMNSGTNMDDDERTDSAGVNGMGGKIVNFLSTDYEVDHADSNGRRLTLTWKNGELVKTRLHKTYSGPAYTQVTYSPNLALFKVTPDPNTGGIPNDILEACMAIAVGSCASVEVPCVVNKKRYTWPSFERFAYAAYLGTKPPASNIIKLKGKGTRVHYEYELLVLNGKFGANQIFINGIQTSSGINVTAVLRAIAATIAEDVGGRVTENSITDYITIIGNATVNKPTFTGQDKNIYTGPEWTVPALTSTDRTKLRTWEAHKNASAKGQKKLIDDVAKTNRTRFAISDLEKLVDANNITKPKDFSVMTLCLCEGDSAAGFFTELRPLIRCPVTGQTGEYTHGMLKLQGKVTNVMRLEPSEVYKLIEFKPGGTNNALAQIVRAMGLIAPKKLDDWNEPMDQSRLRYNRVLIMADADVDGKHIVGLLFSFFLRIAPQFVRDGRVQFYHMPMIRVFRTPISPAARRRISGVPKTTDTLLFTSQHDFQRFTEVQGTAIGRGNIKYYKGLATASRKDAQDDAKMFSQLVVVLTVTAETMEALWKAFGRENVPERKKWMMDSYYTKLNAFSGDLVYQNGFISSTIRSPTMPFDAFVNDELIQYSITSVTRSIPSIMDGFKECQRKVFFTAYVLGEMKPGDLSGKKANTLALSAANRTVYLYGDSSLSEAVTTMTWDYPGACIMPTIECVSTKKSRDNRMPSPRYVEIALPTWIPKVFLPDDNTYTAVRLVEEDQKVEFREFYPIIPMGLVNGSSGVGTGWSSSVPTYNPVTLAQWLMYRMNGERQPLAPYFRYFYGDVVYDPVSKTWTSVGRIRIRPMGRSTKKQSVMIHELPIGRTISEYRIWLDTLVAEGHIGSAEIVVDPRGQPGKHIILLKDVPVGTYDDVHKLGLVKNISTTNMTFLVYDQINQKSVPVIFKSAEDIMEVFYENRLFYYNMYRTAKLYALAGNIAYVDLKREYIRLQIDGYVKINKRDVEQIVKDYMKQPSFMSLISNLIEYSANSKGEMPDVAQLPTEARKRVIEFLGLPQRVVTTQEIDRLDAESMKLRAKYEKYNTHTPEQLWYRKLAKLITYLNQTHPDLFTSPWEDYVSVYPDFPDITKL